MAAASTLPVSLTSSIPATRDSGRGVGSRFAQLVSKFEILNAMSSISQPCSRVGDDSSSGKSSLVSPSHVSPNQVSPARRRSLAPGRPSTPPPESSALPSKGFQDCARHKSVAERRKMFEERGESNSSSTRSQTRKSVDTSSGSPFKMVGSRSWQTIHSGSLAREHTDDSISAQLSPSAVARKTRPKSGALALLMKGQHSQPATLYASASVSTVLPKPRANKSPERQLRDLPPLNTSGALYHPRSSPRVSTAIDSSPHSSTQRPQPQPQPQSRIPRPVCRKEGQLANHSSSASLRRDTTPYQSPTAPYYQQSQRDSPLQQTSAKGDRRPSRRSFRSPGIWATKKTDSPLKDKISLFESLQKQHQDEDSTLSPKPKSPPRGKAADTDYRRRISEAGKSLKSLQMKGALRRLSRSWRRSSSERSIAVHDHNRSPDDTWWLRRDSRTSKNAAAAATTTTSNFSAKNALSGSSTYSNIEQRHPHAGQGFNVDGEGGFQTRGPPSASQSRFRHRISRSGGPFVASAVCSLEQPRPVRANELKRLVSLCKDNVMRRVSGGHSSV